MRQFERFLLFLSELALIFFGFILSFFVAVLFQYVGGGYSAGLGLLGLFFGLFLTGFGLFAFRRKTRPWKIKYDAIGFEISRAERQLHPTRFKYKRIAKRVVVWLPSAIASFTLFLFPIATHLLHPSSHYLTHYGIPIPWTAAIFPSPVQIPDFVMSYIGTIRPGQFEPTSEMRFGSCAPDPCFDDSPWTRRRATEFLSRDLRVANMSVTCWQYTFRRDEDRSPAIGRVNCTTRSDVSELNFYAYFYGREEDIPAFYKIVQGMTPVK